jgi:hypothetical protein
MCFLQPALPAVSISSVVYGEEEYLFLEKEKMQTL